MKASTCIILLLLLIFCGSLLPSTVLASAKNNRLAVKQYNLAKARYNNIKYSPTHASVRKNWLLCARAFYQSYKREPYHILAPSSLLTLGHLYYKMYKRFGKSTDLNEALSYYDDVVSLFPKHSYADDALYKTAKIYAQELHDYKNASLIIARLLAVYPGSDMVKKAATDLKAIKKNRQKVTQINTRAKAVQNQTTKYSPKKSNTGRSEIRNVRHWSTDNYTRVVIETSNPVTYSDHLLKKDGSRPRRLYLNLHNSQINKKLQKAIPIKDGLLQRVRSAQFKPDVVRVVLDTSTLSEYKIFTLDEPFRIVIDVKGTASPAIASTAKKTAPTNHKIAKLPNAPSLAQQLGLHINRVILDPGHGGKDPGAVGVGGLLEKDIVLKVAKKLARKLSKELGCEVVLTRKRDVFVPLEERTAIANSKEGDLFISIHANAARSSKAKGVETYYLDFANTKAEMRIAAKENSISARKISDLQKILSNLMQDSKKNESAKLAGIVQTSVVNGLAKKYSGIKNHGVKKAPFIVLIGAQMPSILTEIAFISNKTEAKRLQSDKYLETLADSITEGIVKYATVLNMAGL